MNPDRRPRRTRRDPWWKLALAFFAPLLVAGTIVIWLSSREEADVSSGPAQRASNVPDVTRKNVLVVMADDETLDAVRVMSNTKRLIGDQGTTFENFYVSFPNCCPSRATFVTGQYAHNNGVTDNLPPNGGFYKLRSDETVPVWLQRGGYYTASIGKYLNTWGQQGIDPPPGWSHWFGLIDPTTYHYYSYSVSNDGKRQDYGNSPEDYQTDVLGAEASRTITEAGKSGKPWFIEWTPLAPHAQYSEKANTTDNFTLDESTFPEPAPRYKGRFASEALPSSPSFNQQDVSQNPPLLQLLPSIDPAGESRIAQIYRSELETVLGVDEWVGRLVQTLQDTHQLDNTVIIFTSDNGVFHGEHRIPFGKVFLYEPATHMPLMIRGPGFPAGRTVRTMAVNADLAPTIVGITGVHPTLTMDGHDLQQVVEDPGVDTDRAILLESWLNRGKDQRIAMTAVHTEQWVLMRWDDGYTALYDLVADPGETNNRSDDPTVVATKAVLSSQLDQLTTCAGATCQLELPGPNLPTQTDTTSTTR